MKTKPREGQILSFFSSGVFPQSQDYFFDFVSSFGGDELFKKELKEAQQTGALPSFSFSLWKQFFEPGEIIEDTIAIDMIFFQLIRAVETNAASCNFEGAVNSVAAYFFVNNQANTSSDFFKK